VLGEAVVNDVIAINAIVVVGVVVGSNVVGLTAPCQRQQLFCVEFLCFVLSFSFVFFVCAFFFFFFVRTKSIDAATSARTAKQPPTRQKKKSAPSQIEIHVDTRNKKKKCAFFTKRF
jgi:hypothetical protein